MGHFYSVFCLILILSGSKRSCIMRTEKVNYYIHHPQIQQYYLNNLFITKKLLKNLRVHYEVLKNSRIPHIICGVIYLKIKR